MTRSKQTKRRRREGTVPYTTDSTEDDSASDDREYHHKSKGKEKLQEQEEQYAQEEDAEERGVSPQVDDVIEQVCGICLTEEGEERGKLDCCDHYFCFGCIMEWAKVESRCPACKQRFGTIVRPALRGVPRSQQCIFRIPHRNQVYEPSEEEIRQLTDPYQHTICSECQEAGDEGLLLLCDGCDAAAHTYCVGLGRTVPRGDWFCNVCSAGHVRELSDDEEEEQGGESSTPLLTFVVTQVHPLRRRQPPRRGSSAPRLNRSGDRHTRLNPAPVPSQEARALLLTASDIPSVVESPVGGARTLSQQRNLRRRIQDMRSHWGQIRSGELQFSSNRLAALPRTRSSNHENNDLNAIVPANPSSSVAGDDIAQAWAMMEQARGLRGDRVAPVVPEQEIRVRRNREMAIVSTRNEGATHLPQRNPSRGRQARLDNTREGSERESIVSRSSRQGSSHVDPDVEATYLQELRISREHSNALRSSREQEQGRFADYDRERGQSADYERERGRSVDYERERGRSADYERERGRSADLHKERQRGLSADHKEREIGRSADRERERDNSRKRSGKRTPREEEKHSHPLVGLSGREGKDVKDQFLHMVKMELKPLFQLGHIDKKQHKRIAWAATQQLLAAFGLEHRGPETRAFGSLSSTCTHMSSSSSTSTFLPSCCSQCLRHHVHKVVGSLVQHAVGIRGL